MKKAKKCLALFTTISLLLTACDNTGLAMGQDTAEQLTDSIKQSQITMDVSGTVAVNEKVLLIGGVQVFLERVQEDAST